MRVVGHHRHIRFNCRFPVPLKTINICFGVSPHFPSSSYSPNKYPLRDSHPTPSRFSFLFFPHYTLLLSISLFCLCNTTSKPYLQILTLFFFFCFGCDLTFNKCFNLGYPMSPMSTLASTDYNTSKVHSKKYQRSIPKNISQHFLYIIAVLPRDLMINCIYLVNTY